MSDEDFGRGWDRYSDERDTACSHTLASVGRPCPWCQTQIVRPEQIGTVPRHSAPHE